MIAAQAPAPAVAEPAKPASPAAPQARTAAPSTSAGGALLQRCGAAGCRGPRPGADPSEPGGGCGCSSGTATARARIDGDDALGRLLARSVAQRATAAPHYKDSETEAPGVRAPDEVLDAARRQAMRFVAAARAALAAPPNPRSTYGRALRRHFLDPTPGQRAKIRQYYDVIATSLVVENYVVTRGLAPVDGVAHPCDGYNAYWRTQDDLIYLCPLFWDLSPFCQAVTLIHEGAHDANVDAHLPGHQPNRGSAMYEEAGKRPTTGVTAADRIANPDVYGFFAAHVALGHDSQDTCGKPQPRRRR